MQKGEFVIQKGNPDKPEDSSSIEAISITPTEEYCNISNNTTQPPIIDTLPPKPPVEVQPPAQNTMLIPNILNVAINLLFIYLVLSLLLSALQEQVVVFLALRAKNLKSSIETLLGDGDQKAKLLTNNLYQHPLIRSLNQQGNRWLKGIINKFFKKIIKKDWKSVGPSYLKPQTFSNTLLALLQKDYGLDFNTYSDETEQIMRQLKEELDRRKQEQLPANSQNNDNEASNLSELPDDLLENLYALARQTKNKADEGKATIKEFQKNLANWFDESMERATGVYKRNAFGLSLLLGSIIAVIGNVDTIHIINQLYNDPALNETLSGFVTQQVNTIKSECESKLAEEQANCLQSKFQEIDVNDIRSFPIGWQVQQTNTNSSFFNYGISLKRQQSLFFTIFGWLITAFALAQGAPFWFDLLNKAINVRSSVSYRRRETKEKEEEEEG